MKLTWIVDRRGDTGLVVDQGVRPTCLSCATSIAHGHLSGAQKSIEFLHHASRSKTAGAGRFSSIQDALRDDGQPAEEQWPYDPLIDDLLAVPPSGIIGPFARAALEIEPAVDASNLVTELQGGGLPVVGIATTRRFMFLKNEVLNEPDAHLDRHAVLLVGAAAYTGSNVSSLATGDILMCVQNSWGPNWGIGGFGLIGPRAWDDMVLVAAVIRSL